jgi:hypothetical protein
MSQANDAGANDDDVKVAIHGVVTL